MIIVDTVLFFSVAWAQPIDVGDLTDLVVEDFGQTTSVQLLWRKTYSTAQQQYRDLPDSFKETIDGIVGIFYEMLN